MHLLIPKHPGSAEIEPINHVDRPLAPPPGAPLAAFSKNPDPSIDEVCGIVADGFELLMLYRL